MSARDGHGPARNAALGARIIARFFGNGLTIGNVGHVRSQCTVCSPAWIACQI